MNKKIVWLALQLHPMFDKMYRVCIMHSEHTGGKESPSEKAKILIGWSLIGHWVELQSQPDNLFVHFLILTTLVLCALKAPINGANPTQLKKMFRHRK